MPFAAISTDRAPAAIGPYSQAIRAGNVVYLSGQIGLDPATGELASDNVEGQTRRVFDNLQAVAHAAGGTLGSIAKLTVYLTNIDDYPTVNTVMEAIFTEPYPARAAVAVAALPKAVAVEVDAILVL